MKMREELTIENELQKALLKFSFGKLTAEQARDKAKEIAPNFDFNNAMLGHKGIVWYARQVLIAMGMRPTIEEMQSLLPQ